MSASTSPSNGAGPLSMSVACALLPAITLVVFRVNEVSVSASGGMQPKSDLNWFCCISEVSLAMAKETLHDILGPSENAITIEMIQKVVADYFKIRDRT
jgi:hypothetical protein